ncbi:MAG: hypothetical protein NTZ80_03095 [Patescibacteria group bacterium]|nr:hypothetical protein [Patescibacteria group bacterium]
MKQISLTMEVAATLSLEKLDFLRDLLSRLAGDTFNIAVLPVGADFVGANEAEMAFFLPKSLEAKELKEIKGKIDELKQALLKELLWKDSIAGAEEQAYFRLTAEGDGESTDQHNIYSISLVTSYCYIDFLLYPPKTSSAWLKQDKLSWHPSFARIMIASSAFVRISHMDQWTTCNVENMMKGITCCISEESLSVLAKSKSLIQVRLELEPVSNSAWSIKIFCKDKKRTNCTLAGPENLIGAIMHWLQKIAKIIEEEARV